MVTILTDKTADDMGLDMYKQLTKTRQDIKHFCLENMRIEPCYACRGCEEKTYGRCVIRDDADLILPCLSRSETIVAFTPIVFGGYSFQMKRIVDKFSLIVGRHYNFQNGELVKEKYMDVNYYVIGIHDGVETEEIQTFKQLVMENIKIVSWKGKPFVLPYETDEYDRLIQKVAES